MCLVFCDGSINVSSITSCLPPVVFGLMFLMMISPSFFPFSRASVYIMSALSTLMFHAFSSRLRHASTRERIELHDFNLLSIRLLSAHTSGFYFLVSDTMCVYSA